MLTFLIEYFSVAASRPTSGRRRSRWGETGWADERGDVPGWVLITLMTAGLVLIIWGLAGPALSGVFQQAIDRVSAF
jgi:hypothetical protein